LISSLFLAYAADGTAKSDVDVEGHHHASCGSPADVYTSDKSHYYLLSFLPVSTLRHERPAALRIAPKMFCTQCSLEARDNDKFCSGCGAALPAATSGRVVPPPDSPGLQQSSSLPARTDSLVGADSNQSASFGPRLPGPAIGWVLVLVICVVLVSVFKPRTLTNEQTNRSVVESAPGVGATNDAEILISRCGQPSKDDSTDYDNPRPPIPTRIVEYKNQRLRFMFIPGGGAQLGDPPPYHWKLVGVTDMTAKDPSKARVVSASEAVRRMPCWSGE
jgi:hypothetical protein